MRRLSAAVGILLLTGCSTVAGDSAPTEGSLGHVGQTGRGCTSIEPGDKVATTGWETLTNSASTPVRITQVSNTSLHDVQVTGNRIATVTGNGLMGNVAGNGYSKSAKAWINKSRPAVGGVMAPDETVMLLQFLRIHDGGTLGQVRITYTDADGNEHLWAGGSTFAFVVACKGHINWPSPEE